MRWPPSFPSSKRSKSGSARPKRRFYRSLGRALQANLSGFGQHEMHRLLKGAPRLSRSLIVSGNAECVLLVRSPCPPQSPHSFPRRQRALPWKPDKDHLVVASRCGAKVARFGLAPRARRSMARSKWPLMMAIMSGVVLSALRTHVSACVQQKLRHFGVVSRRRSVRRRHSVTLSGVDVRRLFQQRPHGFAIAIHRGVRDACVAGRRRGEHKESG